MRMKYRFRDMPIAHKITMAFFAIIIPIIMLGATTYIIASNVVVEKSIHSTVNNLTLILYNLKSLKQNMQSYSVNISMMLNSGLESLSGEDSAEINTLVKQRYIESTINYVIYSYPDIEMGMVITDEDYVMGTQFGRATDQLVIPNSAAMLRIKEGAGDPVWLDATDFLVPKNRVPSPLSIGRRILDMNTGHEIYTLVLSANPTYMSKFYTNLRLGETGKFYIADSEWNIISSQNPEEIGDKVDSEILFHWGDGASGGKAIDVNGRKTLSACVPFEELGWYVMAEVPISELTSENRTIGLMTLAACFACIFIIFLLSGLFTKYISQPVNKLNEFTQIVAQEHFSTRFEVSSRDEIGQLGNSINAMIARTNTLMQTILDEQAKKQGYELMLLQSQINPHFLYNTLELISSLSKLGKNTEVVSTVNSLSRFYRIALSNGLDLISVSMELENVKCYCEIVKMSLGGNFEYTIDMDDNIGCKSIPKLTIQPIVENAAKYGIKQGQKGKVDIRAFSVPGGWCISVRDYGGGMKTGIPPDKTLPRENNPGGGFGLQNIDRRLKLFFAGRARVEITETSQEGTTVSITIDTVANEE